jgi:hypothetical protein
MRSLLLSFTVLTAFAVTPAVAQTTPPPASPAPGKVVTGPPDLPSVQPLSPQASNINGADTRSVIAPALPSAHVGPNASATDYLEAARQALQARQTGRAQSALENAETLLLTRSVPMGATGSPDNNPAVHNVQAALQSLASNDSQGAMNLVQETISMTQQAQAGQYGMGQSGMPMGTGPMGAPPPPPSAQP